LNHPIWSSYAKDMKINKFWDSKYKIRPIYAIKYKLGVLSAKS
jgi:hypothetical protein